MRAMRLRRAVGLDTVASIVRDPRHKKKAREHRYVALRFAR
jgi:hypothetical protein